MKRPLLRLRDMRAAPTLSRPALRLVIAAACVLFVACSDGQNGDAQPDQESTTTSAPSSTTTSGAVTSTTTPASTATEASVLADYAAAKVALEEAERIPDQFHPPLIQRWAGELLKDVQQQLLILETNGWVIKGTTARDPKVRSIEGTTAVIWDCIRTDAERFNAKTGEVVNPTGPLTLGFEETLVIQDGVWKIVGRVDQEAACSG